MKRIYTRSDWGAHAPTGAMTPQSGPKEAFVHYADAAGASKVRSLAAQKEAMRSIQRFHQNERGWSDIGYHYVIFQSYGTIPGARAFKARDINYVPAAQAGHNTGTLAICVFAGPGDPLKRNTRWLIEKIIRDHPTVKKVGGHRDVTSTDCPGSAIYAELDKIAKGAGVVRF